MVQCGIAPFRNIGNNLANVCEPCKLVARQSLPRILAQIVGICRPEKAKGFSKLGKGRAAILHCRKGRFDARGLVGGERAACCLVQPGPQERHQPVRVAGADEMRVDVIELGKIKP